MRLRYKREKELTLISISSKRKSRISLGNDKDDTHLKYKEAQFCQEPHTSDLLWLVTLPLEFLNSQCNFCMKVTSTVNAELNIIGTTG